MGLLNSGKFIHELLLLKLQLLLQSVILSYLHLLDLVFELLYLKSMLALTLLLKFYRQ